MVVHEAILFLAFRAANNEYTLVCFIATLGLTVKDPAFLPNFPAKEFSQLVSVPTVTRYRPSGLFFLSRRRSLSGLPAVG